MIYASFMTAEMTTQTTTQATTRAIIAEKLTKAFAPAELDVIDESHKHAGHAGARPGGQTHFSVHIVSQAFHGKSRIERHRMVNAALAYELQADVHALAIRAAAPGEG
jgi:BolA family transcriptional regulator, general stress-responsive regulator